MRQFDRKFGAEFVQSLPPTPGVYFFHDEKAQVIYVGKAKNLRRRLSQYRNAKRLKRHRRMRSILNQASRLTWEALPTELDAFLKETRIIQTLRPRWNIAGAFSFLYPFIGVRAEGGEVFFCLTSLPEQFLDFQFFGAFRSREVTGDAFFALMRLLKFVGHSVPQKKLGEKRKRSFVFGFRRLPQRYETLWVEFFQGLSFGGLELLSLSLIENAGARAKASEIEEDLKTLRKFWKLEAHALQRMVQLMRYPAYPVPQTERDPLFLSYRMQLKLEAS